jgi:hypothetical protein
VDLHFALMAGLRSRYPGRTVSVIDLLSDVVDEALTQFPERYRVLLNWRWRAGASPNCAQSLTASPPTP